MFEEAVKVNGLVYGVESSGGIQESEGCQRNFSHIKEKIVLNIKNGHF